jgi:DNA-3-methyladenine glycosylase II
MDIEAAEKHLATVEPRFKPLIERHGPCILVREERGIDIYQSLMSSILYQQLSTKAAATIERRFYELFPGETRPPADKVAVMTTEEFRAVGVSRQKASYLQDLASKYETIPSQSELEGMSNEDIIARLVPIKGIGKWSVEMLLMFTLGRMDVLPIDDMGVQEGVKRFLELETRPKPKQMHALAESWSPYRSVGSWYMWRLLDNPSPVDSA